MDFWDSFWPGLWSNGIATLIGVAVGVPIALRIDRNRRASGSRADQAADAERLRRVIEALRSAIDGNSAVLDGLADSVRRKKVPLDVSFNVAVWEAVRPDVVRLIDDPDLQVRLATYFEDLGEMTRIQLHLIDTTVGVAASISGSDEVRELLFGIIDEGAKGLIDRSVGLVADLEERNTNGDSRSDAERFRQIDRN